MIINPFNWGQRKLPLKPIPKQHPDIKLLYHTLADGTRTKHYITLGCEEVRTNG